MADKPSQRNSPFIAAGLIGASIWIKICRNILFQLTCFPQTATAAD